ncbi:hypothetical protein AN2396.2 [Aspergillus nidulans FGSC A4]|uniref:NAD(P)-binding domain-containing protein n=1 Tax=Emericella nidulans (strain FGSC A4 / ATCC 38163 / CBS 112.46 / NRRL 194 / M139) TaxID=227321 RepID=Q5BAN4_EMENI|nr:hypothetical protein [Aspergillus nidulans FGSC A4]EAA64507.1 hypothetical protein AN2396.2 [Aspergillus nidulans FGSC A4]CBF86758.1 TPA: conserved hypothetical protein [Aspergillus nidulans FGSC A4]|eukprot:XP_660000.1 hypothetical protein AN2396.2 [Aspergillus nidulans FGSC A4]
MTFRSAYPKINLLFASHEDKAAIARAVAEHDLVLHFALSADHLPSAEAIVSGLEARGGGIYIHTSGTDVLLDPHENSTRAAREYVLRLLMTGRVLGSLCLCLGLQLSDGKTLWNCVHVYDLSRLYVRFIEQSISSGELTWNEEGYYLVESGTYLWGDISRRITNEAYVLGLLPSEQMMVVEMKDRDILAPAGRPVGNYAVKAKAVRARRLLGWTPIEGSLEQKIPAIVLAEAKSLGL